MIKTSQYRNIKKITIAAFSLLIAHPEIATSQTQTSLRVVVNSNQDGAIAPDEALTLREAIEIVNGTLPLDKLSPSEKALVQNHNESPRIELNLPPGQTTITLQKLLPPLAATGLVVDGTTQPGYNNAKSPTTEISIPQPIVSITPAAGVEVFRGFTVIADKVTIRGLSLYGFTSHHRTTETTPPADIFITSADTNFSSDASAKNNFSVYRSSALPQNVLIENNWLGITPNADIPLTTSAFGVFVFNAGGTVIRRNRISFHDGSGIITGNQATGTQVIENLVLGNGVAGIPDAIRLDGVINKSEIRSNLICGNDGSGVFLFKPQGSVKILDNQIKFNGRRLRRAAIFVMGTDHQIQDNQISYQRGPGVVVSAFPPGGSLHDGAAVRNLIQNNRFSNLAGLSIDLNTRSHVGVEDFQRGDGKNPRRDSTNRRLDTGNGGINAPEFLAPEFLIIEGKVNLDGVADPGSEVDIYRVGVDGALNEVITSVKTDMKGRFGATLQNLQPGISVSAIATDPKYGTSEPADIAVVVTKIGEKLTEPPQPTTDIPNCLTSYPQQR